jgi:acyl-CoA oxidase
VQFNLFAGSILGLGNERQVKMLEDVQEKGQLGCFALTEVGAGVLS